MMAPWVLILVFSSGPGIAVYSVDFASQAACERARDKILEAASGPLRNDTALCVARQ